MWARAGEAWARAGELVDRLRYHAAAAALALGLALAPASREAAGAAAGAVLLVAVAARRRRAGVLCAALLATGVLAGEARLRAIDAPGERLEPYAQVDERAVLLERPRRAGARTQAAIRLESGPGRGARLLAVAEASWHGPTEPGAELRVRGIARPPPPADEEADFDWAAHLRRRGISHELQLAQIAATGRRRGGIAGALDGARRRAEAAIERGLPPAEAALMRGMVLGQDAEIDPLTVDDWRDSGLAHLLAVSGQNVMLLCALALPLLAMTGTPPRTRIAVLIALIALYVPLAGAGASVQRAAVMGGAGLVALGASRPASASYGLLLAAVATLLLNPRITGDAGWQLSFAAVTGILAGRPLAPHGPVAGALWITAVATVATAPLLAVHFEAVPVVSLAANMAALPAVAPVMWAGMAQAAVGQLAALGPPGEAVAGAAAGALGLLAEPLIAWLQAVATAAAGVPNAVVDVSVPGLAGVAAAYALLAAAGLLARAAGRRIAPHLEALRAVVRVSSRRTLAVLAVAACAAAALLAWPAARPAPPARLTVSFLDVGQGDATLIQHPDGSAVLFDGGPAAARVARLVKQAGVRRLSAVVATHASADHHGGLPEVLRRFPVGLLVDGGDGTTDPQFRAVLREARARDVPVRAAYAGQRLRAGALSVRVLSPAPRSPGPAPEDPNPRAVVAVVSAGAFDLLLSADAESPTLMALPLPEVEAMKVPHHGSEDAGLREVLRALRPEVAVIPVGENSYGHPHPETLRTLARLVPHVRRTDHDGTVRLEVTGERMALD